MAQNHGIPPGENPRIAVRDSRIGGKHLVARKAGAELDAPCTLGRKLYALLQLVDKRIGSTLKKCHHLSAVRDRLLGLAVAPLRPFVRRDPRDRLDVSARLQGQAASSGEPAAHARRAGIVGGSGKPEIPELVPELAQELRRLG